MKSAGGGRAPSELTQVLLAGKTILILSPEPWGVNFVSKHHYAMELSKANQVFFVGPPKSPWSLARPKGVAPNLRILDWPRLPGLNRLPVGPRFLVQRALAAWLKFQAGNSFDVVWNFCPYYFQDLSAFGDRCLQIYHPVDVHHTLLEAECVRTADITLATSDLILKRLPEGVNPRFQVNHGLGPEFTPPFSPWTPGKTRLNVGYVGNLRCQYLDYVTLIQIVRENPAMDFNFIGPTGDSNLGSFGRPEALLSKLPQLPNAHFHGQLKPADVRERLGKMDLFLMCYTGDRFPAHMANPHKMLEYLSTGRVVVCNYCDQYRDASGLVCMATTNEELPRVFQETVANLAYHNRSNAAQNRWAYAQDNTYPRQIERIENLLSQLSTRW